MLPIFAGRAPNLANHLNKSHPLYHEIGMVGCYRFIPPLSNNFTVKDLTGNGYDMSLLLNARIYGRDGPVYGCSERQSTGQFPRIPASIWGSITGTDIAFGMWLKFNSFPNLGYVIDTADNDFAFSVDGGGGSTANSCHVRMGSTSSASITLNQTLTDDRWYRFVVALQQTATNDVTIWIDGVQAATASFVKFGIGAMGPIDIGNNSSGGGNNLSGFIGDIFVWNTKPTDALAALDYQEALYGFPRLFPEQSIWQRAPAQDTSATGTVTDIGTITLTAPTATAFEIVDATGTVADIGTITLTAPTVAGAIDAVGTVTDIGVITLTAPTVSAGTPSNTGVVGLIGVIYLYAPTVYPITSPLKNNWGTTIYWGRHMRGSYLNLQIQLPEQPFDVPIADVWSGTTLIETVEVPCLDPEDLAFGLPLFISDAYDDGNYFVVFRFTIKHVNLVQFAMFEVSGGVARHPVISVLEIQRALGQGVVSQRDDGVVHLGYNPSLSGEME